MLTYKQVINISFCGAFAGGDAWSGYTKCAASTGVDTCQEYVATNPGAFKDVYFEFNSIKIFQRGAGPDGVQPAPGANDTAPRVNGTAPWVNGTFPWTNVTVPSNETSWTNETAPGNATAPGNETLPRFEESPTSTVTLIGDVPEATPTPIEQEPEAHPTLIDEEQDDCYDEEEGEDC